MYSLKTNKIIALDKEPEYYRAIAENDFPIRTYITKKYGYSPSVYYCDDTFSEEIIPFLFENGKLMNFALTGHVKDTVTDKIGSMKSGFYWFKYKDVYLKISLKNDGSDDDVIFGPRDVLPQGLSDMLNSSSDKNKEKSTKKTYNICFFAPTSVQDYALIDFEKFIIIDDNKTKVHLFIKNQYGEYTFEPIAVNLPKTLDLELNYGKKFLDIDKLVKERLFEKPNGLYMFHGPPGTGKTTYIKYLASCVDRDFIYIPTTMIEYFTSDPNCLHTLIQKPNSIIILEDAEKAILKRVGDGMDSSAVSSLLNLSDGILSDILKTSVIVTYNCPKQDIDDALKRKGRLQAEYEFDLLSVEDARKLAKHLKYPKKFIEDKINDVMSLSDVYNLQKEVNLTQKNEKSKQRVIGFNQN
jgi:hypothetical protein